MSSLLKKRLPGPTHGEYIAQQKQKKLQQSKQTPMVRGGNNDPRNLTNITYAKLIAAENDWRMRKYAIVRSSGEPLPANFMLEGGDDDTQEGAFFVFLNSQFPGTSYSWDSFASITAGEYDSLGTQYALSLDMSFYGYNGIRISSEYGDKTLFTFALDYYNSNIPKLYDKDWYPMLWHNTLGPRVINSSLKTLGVLNSLSVSGGSTMGAITSSGNISTSRNVFAGDVVATNLWSDYCESGYVYANTVEATNWVGLPSNPVDPTDFLPLTLDTTHNRVGVNQANPQYTLDVNGDANITGFTTLKGVSSANITCSGNISADTVDAATSMSTAELTCSSSMKTVDLTSTGTSALSSVLATNLACMGNVTCDTVQAVNSNVQNVVSTNINASGNISCNSLSSTTTVTCDTVNAQHYLNLPVSDILPITLDKTNNRVGINTATPTTALDVVGNTHVDGNVMCDNLSVTDITASGSVVAGTSLETYGELTVDGPSYLTDVFSNTVTNTGRLETDTIYATTYENLNVQPITLDKTNSRVGINQSTPTQALDVTGNLRTTGQISADTNIYASVGLYANSTPIRSSTGTPEGVITANVGALYLRQDGAAGTSLYIKQSGTGNTGWTAVNPSGGSTDLTPITLDKINSRVGIKNATPQYELDVTGSIHSPIQVVSPRYFVDTSNWTTPVADQIGVSASTFPTAVVASPATTTRVAYLQLPVKGVYMVTATCAFFATTVKVGLEINSSTSFTKNANTSATLLPYWNVVSLMGVQNMFHYSVVCTVNASATNGYAHLLLYNPSATTSVTVPGSTCGISFVRIA